MLGAASFQGPPRPGRRAFGVPPGGAFDQESFALANALVGNAAGAAALELGMGVLELTAEAECSLAIVGAHAEVRIGSGIQVTNGSYMLHAGNRLSVTAPTGGARVYLAGPGGVSGALRSGGAVAFDDRRQMPPRKLAEQPASLRAHPLRLVPGAQAARFASSALERAYKVGPLIDRMGLRLEGEALSKGPDIVSEPCTPGTIQVTNDGSLLILGPDGPTIGGYPKLAHVISADLDRLGQLRPGDEVRMELVSIEEAQAALRERRERLAGILRLLSLTSQL